MCDRRQKDEIKGKGREEGREREGDRKGWVREKGEREHVREEEKKRITLHKR